MEDFAFAGGVSLKFVSIELKFYSHLSLELKSSCLPQSDGEMNFKHLCVLYLAFLPFLTAGKTCWEQSSLGEINETINNCCTWEHMYT